MSHQAKVIEIMNQERSLIRPSPDLSFKGNAKLKRNSIVNFSLPAGTTCPGAGSCNGNFCYAQTGNYMRANVIRRQVQNFLASQKSYFVDVMLDRIYRLQNVEYIRIHDSGDFYSLKYIAKWCEIVKQAPHIKFYAYTKSYTHFDLTPLWLLENMNLIQSVGSKNDSLIDYLKPHAKIFSSLEELNLAGYVDCSMYDLPAAQGVAKVGLLIHGQKKRSFTA